MWECKTPIFKTQDSVELDLDQNRLLFKCIEIKLNHISTLSFPHLIFTFFIFCNYIFTKL
jgi:hypothetical protein